MKLRLEIAVLAFLVACGHAAPTPVKTAAVPTPGAAAASAPASPDGNYLFHSVPEPNTRLFVRIEGTRAWVRGVAAVSTEQADQEAPVSGAYPFFKVGHKEPEAYRVLFTSPDGGFVWMAGHAPGSFSREVPLPSDMAGAWSMVSPQQPERVLGQVTLGPDFLIEQERDGEAKRSPALYLRGSDGCVSMFSFDHPDQPVQMFLVDGALVAKIERKDALLGFRAGKRPAWLSGGAAAPSSGKAGVFHPFGSPGVRLHIAGENLSVTSSSGAVGEIPFARIASAGPLSRYKVGSDDKQAVFLWSSPWSFAWLGTQEFTLVAPEAPVPSDLRGEWIIVPIADFSVGVKVRFSDGGATLETGEETQDLRWLDGGYLAGEQGLYRVHRSGDAWVMATPTGRPSVLYRDKPPTFAPGRDGLAKQLDQVCAAFAKGESTEFAQRLLVAISQVFERETLADPLAAVLLMVAQVDPAMIETMATKALGSMGLGVPAGCLSLPTKKE